MRDKIKLIIWFIIISVLIGLGIWGSYVKSTSAPTVELRSNDYSDVVGYREEGGTTYVGIDTTHIKKTGKFIIKHYYKEQECDTGKFITLYNDEDRGTWDSITIYEEECFYIFIRDTLGKWNIKIKNKQAE